MGPQSLCLWVTRVGGILASWLPSRAREDVLCQSFLLSGMWQGPSLLQDPFLALPSSAYMGSSTRFPPPHPSLGSSTSAGGTLHTRAPPPAAHITEETTQRALLLLTATSVVTLPSSQCNYSNTVSLTSTQCTNTLSTITKSFIILH